MQKKVLAAIIGSVIAGQSMALTVVDDGTNKFTIDGHVGILYSSKKSEVGTKVDRNTTTGLITKYDLSLVEKAKTMGDDSRIAFGLESEIADGTMAFAKAEWGYDVTNTDKGVFSNRLGYVGLKNEQMGSVSFGKQWSSYYMVSGWTDTFALVGGEASGTYVHYEKTELENSTNTGTTITDDLKRTDENFGDVVGTARATDALQYNMSFEGFNLSLQYQLGKRRLSKSMEFDLNSDGMGDLRNMKRDGAYGFAASYDLPMGLSFGAAHNEAKIKGDRINTTQMTDGYNKDSYKAKATIFAVKYEADRIYTALSYGMYKRHAFSTFQSSMLGRGVKPGAGDDQKWSDVLYEKAKGLEFYASYQIDDNFKIEGGYNELKNDKNVAYDNTMPATNGKNIASDRLKNNKLKYFPLGLVYTQGPIQLSGTYVLEKSTMYDPAATTKNYKKELSDRFIVQARYYF